MKRRLSIILIGLVIVASCKKKEGPRTHYVSAKAGTFDFYASGSYITTKQDHSGTGATLSVNGIMPSGAAVALWIDPFTGKLDTLSLDGASAGASFLRPTPAIESPAVYGTLIITGVTPDVTGVFTFTCTDSTHVTGHFNVAP